MNGYVVDASVAVKWMVEEDLSTESASLLDAGLTLQAPELLFAEVANALWAMHRRGPTSMQVGHDRWLLRIRNGETTPIKT